MSPLWGLLFSVFFFNSQVFVIEPWRCQSGPLYQIPSTTLIFNKDLTTKICVYFIHKRKETKTFVNNICVSLFSLENQQIFVA